MRDDAKLKIWVVVNDSIIVYGPYNMDYMIWSISYVIYDIYEPYYTVYMIWIRFYDKFDSEKLKWFYHKSISIEGPGSRSLAINDLSWD